MHILYIHNLLQTHFFKYNIGYDINDIQIYFILWGQTLLVAL